MNNTQMDITRSATLSMKCTQRTLQGKSRVHSVQDGYRESIWQLPRLLGIGKTKTTITTLS